MYAWLYRFIYYKISPLHQKCDNLFSDQYLIWYLLLPHILTLLLFLKFLWSYCDVYLSISIWSRYFPYYLALKNLWVFFFSESTEKVFFFVSLFYFCSPVVANYLGKICTHSNNWTFPIIGHLAVLSKMVEIQN